MSLPIAPSIRCSTIGPSARAGKKLSAPTMMTTPISQAMKSGVCVGSVPAPAGTFFLRASEPAMASAGTGQPVAAEEHGDAQAQCCRTGVFAPSPAKALPLLLPAEEKAYSISLKPCGAGVARSPPGPAGVDDGEGRADQDQRAAGSG